MSIRAEEIAACIAISARQSLQRLGQLHPPSVVVYDKGNVSAAHTGGEDKEAQIAALQQKISELQRALV